MRKKHLFLTLMLLVTIFIAFLVWYQTALGSHSRNTGTEHISIASGQKTAAILEDLARKKIIRSPLAMKIYLSTHSDLKLQAGEYDFSPNTTTRQVIKAIASGQVSSQEVSLLFREGLTAKDMQAELTKQGYLTDNSFLTLATTPINKLPASLRTASFLKKVPTTATLEGYLFPDTYRVYKNFTAEDLIKKMLDNFDAKLTADMRGVISKSGHSLSEVVTMASLLEKEVRTEEDMKIVSGIFWDRIKIGQALQSCASLAYILGVNKAQYTYEDTQIDSPYNTYKHPGLTPGPISNPGLRSLRAALAPTKTDYNYFLSRPDTGETVFSVTLDEHNTAKAKYLN